MDTVNFMAGYVLYKIGAPDVNYLTVREASTDNGARVILWDGPSRLETQS